MTAPTTLDAAIARLEAAQRARRDSARAVTGERRRKQELEHQVRALTRIVAEQAAEIAALRRQVETGGT